MPLRSVHFKIVYAFIEFIKSKCGKANSDNSIFLAVKYFNKPALLDLLNDRKKINTIEEGAALADYLSIHIPLSSETKNLIDNKIYTLEIAQFMTVLVCLQLLEIYWLRMTV